MTLASSLSLKALVKDVCYLAYFRAYRRYCGSYLGFAWSLLSPLATIGAYYLVFQIFFKVPIKFYAIYLAAGLLPWICLLNAISASAVELPNKQRVLKNSLSSPLVYLYAVVITEWLFLVTSYIALAIIIIIAGLGSWKMLTLPFFMLPLFIFSIASGVIFGYLGVLFRDIPHLLWIFFQAAFWFVPIVYHWSIVPDVLSGSEFLSGLIQYNPFSLIISSSQIIMHGNALPSITLVVSSYFIAAASAAVAYIVHRRLVMRIVYYL